MRILVTGCNGLLGNDIWKALSSEHEVYASDITECRFNAEKGRFLRLDVMDQKQTYDKISKLNPDVVIQLAVYSDVEGCEQNPEKAFSINALGTRNVCLACQRFDSALCYISTDYVFDGENTPPGGYCEFDQPDPQSVYAKSKYYGELYVKLLLNKFYIVRTAWLFGTGRKNFVAAVVDKINKKEKINVVSDQRGSMTYTKDLAMALNELIKKETYGIYHLTNAESASRLETVEFLFNLLGQRTELNMVTRSAFFTAKRPKDSSLNNLIWKLDGFNPLRNWRDAVYDFVRSST
jgi:dTDP-4-dehydrorhamnose reductase